MTLVVWVAAACIGGSGAVLRFLVDGTVQRSSSLRFPLGTLVVNVSGAFVLGVLTGHGTTSTVALLAGTAAVGSYTTFSTWVFETQRLAEERQYRAALSNLIVSLLIGLAAAAGGYAIGQQL